MLYAPARLSSSLSRAGALENGRNRSLNLYENFISGASALNAGVRFASVPIMLRI